MLRALVFFSSLLVLIACQGHKSPVQASVSASPSLSAATFSAPEKPASFAPSVSDFENGDKIDYTLTRNFFLKNTVPLKNPVNIFIVSDQKSFDTYLAPGRTMTNVIIPPKFDTDMTVIIALEPTDRAVSITVERVSMKDKNIYVSYTATYGERRSFTINPVSIITFKRPAEIQDFYILQNKQDVIRIPFGRRTLDSPVSLTDIQNNYMGTYKGKLPCADCSAVDVTLSLFGDGTYALTENYAGKGIHKTSGRWTPAGDLFMIELTEDGKPASSERDGFYAFAENETLEKYPHGEAPKKMKGFNYRLKKDISSVSVIPN